MFMHRLQPPPHLNHRPIHKSRSETLQTEIALLALHKRSPARTILCQPQIINKKHFGNRHNQLHPSQLRANTHPRPSTKRVESSLHRLWKLPRQIPSFISHPPPRRPVNVWIREVHRVSMQSIQRSADNGTFRNDAPVDHSSAVSNTARHEIGNRRRQAETFFEATLEVFARVQLFCPCGSRLRKQKRRAIPTALVGELRGGGAGSGKQRSLLWMLYRILWIPCQ
jgi:hypothetical protein